MNVVEAVRQRGGVARRAWLPRRQVDGAVARGSLVVPRQGVVALPDLPPAVLLALSLGGVVSCGTAAGLLGLQLVDEPTTTHVTVPRNLATRAPAGVVLHRRDVPTDELTTTLARTAADCARCLDQLDALVVLDQVMAAGISREELLGMLTGAGSAQARELVLLAVALSGSPGETAARLACLRAGLSVQCQVLIQGVGRVDLLVEGKIIVEVDGLAYHSDGRQFASDRRRDAAAQLQGYRVLRFTWVDAIRRPEYVVATIKALLATL